eukprot:CAMPEP_0116008970 /NCGR_PEP_ID=MMETSP0321-20121206/3168_1 /TAXON_ID=163516 /ORGANISM="Leptocylindrus danicus var. danicus, Strain B650" /LENGTH=203 /DNA_ID=CAMNT_0003477871 /DNA_START=51 /DNA_END=662 /DNA_ORIENTATION=+
MKLLIQLFLIATNLAAPIIAWSNSSPGNTNKGNQQHIASRRDVLQTSTATLLSSAILLNTNVKPAEASGGATAGGAYLLSAKQRYNARVQAGAKALFALNSTNNFNQEAAVQYFTPENNGEGSWSDFQSAGYLLANAFRRSSSTAPDALPSVKGWKAFAADVAKLEKAVLKKKGKDAAVLWEVCVEGLDRYLELVELPPVRDL